MESKNKPSLEKVIELFKEAYQLCNCEFIDKYIGIENLLEEVKCAYDYAKDSNNFWSDLKCFLYDCILSNEKYFANDCEEAFKILTLDGKDCEMETFRDIVEKASIITDIGLDYIKPLQLASIFLSSAFSIELDELFSEIEDLAK